MLLTFRNGYRVGCHPPRFAAAEHQSGISRSVVKKPKPAASSVKELELRALEQRSHKGFGRRRNAICPDLFIAGGGISQADKWIHLLKRPNPVVAAELQNGRASWARQWSPPPT